MNFVNDAKNIAIILEKVVTAILLFASKLHQAFSITYSHQRKEVRRQGPRAYICYFSRWIFVLGHDGCICQCCWQSARRFGRLNRCKLNPSYLGEVCCQGGGGLLVVACGGTPTNTTIQLAFWKPPGLPTNLENQFYSNLIASFRKENPSIHVTYLDIPWASASEKYTAAFASNNPPDVSYQILNWLSNFSSQNALMAIEDLNSSGNLFK